MKDVIIIDLNADVGEGVGNESDLMPYLSSCSIACGGHAGDLQTMTRAVKLAISNNLKIGAHPSFPDKVNFGRIAMAMTASDLFISLKQQIMQLQTVLKLEGGQLNHIKPHGALYNLAVKDGAIASVIIKVIKAIPQSVKLYAPPNSVISKLAIRNEIEVVHEAFADRNYNEDLSLVSRQKTNAVLTKKDLVLAHVLGIVKRQKIITINDVEVEVDAATICVHGDTENALEILKYLDSELPKNHILIR